MKQINIPVGVSDFEKIRKNGYYYIDKSGLIPELLSTESTEVTLITRPRRFGKTLGMSMLSIFFDIRKNSTFLFDGLEVLNNKELCAEWMNQWPTLFFTFKDVSGLNFGSAYSLLASEIADLCKEHSYLADSSMVDKDDKNIFLQLKARKGDETEVKKSLGTLMRMMQVHYGKPVILLLDEYDVPIAKASSNGYYKEMLEIIKTMMSTALKDNNALRFAVITGCLRIAKESIFTGTNNFVSDTISDIRYKEYFGFTDVEVRTILKDTDCLNCADKVKEWYDGYHFGDIDVYCPWDVLNYVNKVKTDNIQKPESFWEHTSDNAIIGSFLQRIDLAVTEKFENLLNGGYIKETITENLTYDVVNSKEENLWSLLYLTGYLTKVRDGGLEKGDELQNNQAALRIPNAEVMDIFRKSVVEWFNNKSATSDRREFFTALWDADGEKLTDLLSDLLFDTIIFHDYQESFYHAFMTGLFSGAGYVVESNYENGLGRSDVVIKDRRNRKAVVIEAKIAKSDNEMEKECIDALKQIEDKEYAKKIERSGYKKVIRFGIAFYQKSCFAKAQKV